MKTGSEDVEEYSMTSKYCNIFNLSKIFKDQQVVFEGGKTWHPITPLCRIEC